MKNDQSSRFAGQNFDINAEGSAFPSTINLEVAYRARTLERPTYDTL